MRFDLGEWKAFVESPRYRFRNNGFRVFLFRYVSDLEIEVMHKDGTVTRERSDVCTPDNAEPTFELPEEAARTLMTELWREGIRPDLDEVKETPALLREVIDTQKQHIADLQRALFKRTIDSSDDVSGCVTGEEV